MTDDLRAAMKQATARAIALVTAMQGGRASVLDGEISDAVEWIGLAHNSPEAKRVALQLNQSAHLTTLCIDLLAKALGMTVEQATQRLATLIAEYNERD